MYSVALYTALAICRIVVVSGPKVGGRKFPENICVVSADTAGSFATVLLLLLLLLAPVAAAVTAASVFNTVVAAGAKATAVVAAVDPNPPADVLVTRALNADDSVVAATATAAVVAATVGVLLLLLLLLTAAIIVLTVVVDVVGGIGIYGYDGHGLISCGPSIDSNIYPIIEPAVSPTLYDSVIIFPVTSFKVAGTLAGANIIGKLPARPLVTPSAALNTNADASPAITGCVRGAQHNSSNGISPVRMPDNRINWRRVQLYGTIAIILPIRSVLLNVNISNTGIHVFRLHDMISVSMPGYSDNVTQ